MGETADPRFAEVLARMLGDPDASVPSGSFTALGKVRAAAERHRQGRELRVVALPRTGPEGYRRLALAVVSPRGPEEPEITPTQLVVTEDGQNVAEYEAEEIPPAGDLGVAFVFPCTAAPESGPCSQAALRLLEWKRPGDRWLLSPYLAAGERAVTRVQLREAAMRYTASREEAGAFFDSTVGRVYHREVWPAVEAALQGRGSRGGRLAAYRNFQSGDGLRAGRHGGAGPFRRRAARLGARDLDGGE